VGDYGGPPFWRTPVSPVRGLATVTFKINTKHTLSTHRVSVTGKVSLRENEREGGGLGGGGGEGKHWVGREGKMQGRGGGGRKGGREGWTESQVL
jgi:hypothetical protein